jgi:FKBP-type peptidyl-prolyl cis-trans isomerase
MRRDLSLLCLMLCFVNASCDSGNKTAPVTISPSPAASPSATPPASSTPAPTAAGAEAGMTLAPSGVQYQDIEAGDGPRPLFNQVVRVRYSAFMKDGTKFDSNEDSGKPILEFTIGRGEVIKGWDIGIGGGPGIPPMRVGGHRKLIIPPQLGYGKEPYGTLPGNSTLTFDVRLVGVKR